MRFFFPTVLLAIIAGALIYVSRRFLLYFPTVPKWIWWGGFTVLLTVSLVSMMAISAPANTFIRVWSVAASVICIAFLFLVFAIALTDLMHIFYKCAAHTRGMITLMVCGLFTVVGLYTGFSTHVQEITLPVKGLTHEITAVHLSDIHLGNTRGENQVKRIVKIIQKLQPDVVFNTGDLFDSKAHFGTKHNILEAFRTIPAPHYFVYGNHDEYVGVKTVLDMATDAGLIVLQNQVAEFEGVQIIGLNNMAADSQTQDIHAGRGSRTIESVLDSLSLNPEAPTVVLHHRPAGENYMAAKGADLLLAGHTHAGQIFPFTGIAKWMFHYNRGLYKFQDMDIYVSQGVGTVFSPIRLGTRSTIALIRLTPADF